MNGITKEDFTKSAIWRTVETITSKGISMIVSVILTRLILPEEYGLLSLTGVFINISNILIDGGFGSALVRKSNVSDEDYNSVFVLSISIATILYIILFVCSPYIANYYNESELTIILRITGIGFFMSALCSTRGAILTKQMQFRSIFIFGTISSVISGLVGVIAAYCGFGVWALVAHSLSQQIVITILYFSKVKHKTLLRVKWNRIKEMFVFGSGVVGSSLLNYIGGSAYSLVIGKTYNVTDLAYYDKGGQLPMQLSLYTFGSISSVLFPTLSSYQENLEHFKHIVRKVVKMTAFIIAPMMFGMAITSKEIVSIVFTDKWLPCVRAMQYNCLYYLATPFMLINVQVFFALGKSYLRVKSEIIRVVLMLLGIYLFGIVFKLNINVLACVSASIAVINALCTYLDVRKLINYSFLEVATDLWKPMFCSIMMSIIVGVVSWVFKVIVNRYIVVAAIIKTITGIIAYVLLTILLKNDSFYEFINILKGLIKK